MISDDRKNATPRQETDVKDQDGSDQEQSRSSSPFTEVEEESIAEKIDPSTRRSPSNSVRIDEGTESKLTSQANPSSQNVHKEKKSALKKIPKLRTGAKGTDKGTYAIDPRSPGPSKLPRDKDQLIPRQRKSVFNVRTIQPLIQSLLENRTKRGR